MSVSRTTESQLLNDVQLLLNEISGAVDNQIRFEMRTQILEAVAALFGGFDLKLFQDKFNVNSIKPVSELLKIALPVFNAIKETPIHHALALSSLASEPLSQHEQKKTGAYHTDFRLAQRLAELASTDLTYKSKVIDPACGAGILLAALTYNLCGKDSKKIKYWLANGVYAADLSSKSLRAALISLSSFTDDVETLVLMQSKWRQGDSLLTEKRIWSDMASGGFDGVVGNPPWGKMKISRHQFLKSQGDSRHYGSKVTGLDSDKFDSKRRDLAIYSQEILNRFPDLAHVEPDFYIAFTELFLELCKDGGVVAAIVPGGLIRSQGTELVRKKIIQNSQSLSLSIINNRAKFFSIDSRFKFLALKLVKKDSTASTVSLIDLYHEAGTPLKLKVTGKAVIEREGLSNIREDLSFPEVRSSQEWNLFSKINQQGISWDKPHSGWLPKFCREVDMTKDRKNFLESESDNALPVIEGRMVQAYRLGAKGHVSGTGRKAVWEAYPIGSSRLSSQFWINPTDLSLHTKERVQCLRVGFCDIAGQTNERALTATLIPKGVVCGNKVPTIIFPEDTSKERLLVWLAIANSFVFDWMLRRVITTTVNYFLLQSIPLPDLAKNGDIWNRIASTSNELLSLNNEGSSDETYSRVAELRKNIDIEIALAYGLNVKDMELVFQDFAILDRGQPTVNGEKHSTITRDYVLSSMAKRAQVNDHQWSVRVESALQLGALPYIPSEISSII